MIPLIKLKTLFHVNSSISTGMQNQTLVKCEVSVVLQDYKSDSNINLTCFMLTPT